MRGADITQESLFSTVHLDSFVPQDHPLRSVRQLFNGALDQLDGLFNLTYAPFGKESIAPEKLLRALLLQVFYSIRSERQLMEQVQYNLLFRWFIGLSIDDEVWSHSTFSKNRDRLLSQDIIPVLFSEVVERARQQNLVSDEHFSVDGTLIQAWASQKSFRPKDDQDGGPKGEGRNVESDFHGQKRSNATHASTTDSDARNYKKSYKAEAKLGYLGHTLMDNRHGLVVDAEVSQADGFGERTTAHKMLSRLPGKRRKTVGADKGYDAKNFVTSCRNLNVTPHIARNTKRRGGSALDGRTTRHQGYEASLKIRKRIEEGFGWGKTIGQLRQVKHRGTARVDDVFKLTYIGWNLIRICNLQARCV